MQRWEEILMNHSGLFQPVKKNWSPEEIALAYELVNSYTGKAIRDTGCSSCRRSTIGKAIKIAQEWKPKE